jgi:tetratricopeptide (TPR) repeat protein
VKRILLLAVLASACSRSASSDAPAAAASADSLVSTSEANRFAEQAYLEGVADFQKGDLDSAADKFSRCLTLVTTGQTAGGCMAGLELTRGTLERGQDAAAAPAKPAARATPAGRDDSAASQAFLAGMIYFQKGDYEKARGSWLLCVQLSPAGGASLDDCRAGLVRIEKLYGAGSTAPDGKK